MFTSPMRRKAKEITDTATLHAIIQASPVMRLAMCQDNTPYVVPLSFGFDGDCLFFHCAETGVKLDILQHNPKVCALFETNVALKGEGENPCAWGFAFDTVMAQGMAERITDPEQRLQALQLITDHYTPGLSVPAHAMGKVDVWKIRIGHLTGKQTAS